MKLGPPWPPALPRVVAAVQSQRPGLVGRPQVHVLAAAGARGGRRDDPAAARRAGGGHGADRPRPPGGQQPGVVGTPFERQDWVAGHPSSDAQRFIMLPMPSPFDTATVRLDNALILFDEFVRVSAKQADAATLRGLERRFAEKLQIQPSYWSQIKGRSRQIGERLARQFEQNCRKPAGWMDQPHGADATATPPDADNPLPQDEDERFIVGLVLTYYRRHPQRARTRLLDLLGEVLVPMPAPAPAVNATASASAPRPGVTPRPAVRPGPDEDPHSLWLSLQKGVAPLKPKR